MSACLNCGGATSPKNKTGYCIMTEQCRTLANRARRKKTGNISKTGRLLTEVRDLETGEVIIDEVAVHIALTGERRVCLTPTERRIVVRSLLMRRYQAKDVALHMGITMATATKLVREVSDEP